jgi:adenylylsulfate kinase
MLDRNLTPTRSLVDANQRAQLLGQQGAVLWFTGLSGAGKSTLAYAVEKKLIDMGHLSYVLDGDNVRTGLSSDLSFSAEDRQENIRRIGELAALFYQSGMFVLTSFISPYRRDRAFAREKVGEHFIEVFLDVSLEECEKRDPKGLYAKARAGAIEDFTGIDAPYESPEHAEIRLRTHERSIEDCVDTIVEYLSTKGFLTSTAKEQR